MAQKRVLIELEGEGRFGGMLDEVPPPPPLEVLAEFTDPKSGETLQVIRKPAPVAVVEPAA